MGSILLSPPMVFLIFLALLLLLSRLAGALSARGADSEVKTQAYACGESNYANMGQPDFTQFFTVAFFFTIMHVIVLIVTTAPAGMSVMAALYIAAALLSLLILFRR